MLDFNIYQDYLTYLVHIINSELIYLDPRHFNLIFLSIFNNIYIAK